MTQAKHSVTEAELMAYVDGQLSPSQEEKIHQYLQDHPDVARELDDYQAINQQISEQFDAVLDEPIPSRLLPDKPLSFWQKLKRGIQDWLSQTLTPTVRLRAVMAAFTWMAVGAVLATFFHPSAPIIISQSTQQPLDPVGPHLVQPAVFAHAVYTKDIRHPVEVPAEEEKHLVTWLSRRLHTDIQAPNLAEQGYRLMGGRLLPSTNRMAAQFMYEREDGLRATLYVRHGAWENDSTSFRFERDRSVGTFYWIDGPLGYALTGELERSELHALSEAVYHQLHPEHRM